MRTTIVVGDVLDEAADVLISTANPWLNMSGGVNGAIRERVPEIQQELRDYLTQLGRPAIPAGSVVRTSAGSLPFDHIIHAVAIDPFYDSSHELVVQTLTAAYDLARTLHASTVSLPTLATGYGPMSVSAFGRAFAAAVDEHSVFDAITIVVRSTEDASVIKAELSTDL